MALLPPSFLLHLVLLLVLCLGQSRSQDVSPHDGCIHLPIIHSTNTHYFGKRAVSLSLSNRTDIAYYAKLNIGTPPQPVFVQLDTGSFELWVNPLCSSLSGADASFCETVGHYDTAQSSTATSLRVGKTLQYGIGSANITYFKDDISLDGLSTQLKSVQFGVASSSEDQFSGVMGIGYGQGITTRYRNFVDELSAQNATRVKAFTVALGAKDEEEGIVVFGGVDTSRFSGGLAPQPIIPASKSPDNVPRYWINMDSLSLHPPSGKISTYADSNIPVFLDTGSTMTLLPAKLAAQVARDFGSDGVDTNGFYEIGCDLEDIDGTLDFAFNGTTIRVPYKELIRKVEGNPPTCFLGISPSDDFTLLGDTFMRSAYAVFDLEQNIIWMSQSENCGSSPRALTSVSALSTLTGACGVNRVANPATTMLTSTTVATPSPVSPTTNATPSTFITADATPTSSGGTAESSSAAANVMRASAMGIVVAFMAVAMSS